MIIMINTNILLQPRCPKNMEWMNLCIDLSVPDPVALLRDLSLGRGCGCGCDMGGLLGDMSLPPAAPPWDDDWCPLSSAIWAEYCEVSV